MPTSKPKVPHFLLRGVARIIDVMLQVIVLELAYRALPWLPVSGLVTLEESSLFYVDVGVGCTALLVNATLSEWLGGATLGKTALFLRVASQSDWRQPIGFRSALIRNLFFFLDGQMYGMFAYGHMARSKLRQRFGDVMAGSVVVWASDGPQRSPLRGWPVGIFAAWLVVMLSYVITG
jgi:hypothetical protein